MVEVTTVSKEEEVKPLPPVAAADPDSLGQAQLDTLIQIQNGIARQCGLQKASLQAQMVGSKMIETLSKLMGARSQSLEREMKAMLLYLEKELNIGQNVVDSVETTMDKVTTALGGFFFCCIAERAIKPCRSSRSKLRGEFGIPRHLQNRNQKHNKATNKQNTKQKDKNRQVLECETRGEKRVKRPKRPNALICRTPGGSMRYP